MSTPTSIAALIADGYAVAPLDAEWGPEWRGMWRWTNTRLGVEGSDDEPSYSEEDAWGQAAADAAYRALAE
jgi:hypothetical protein